MSILCAVSASNLALSSCLSRASVCTSPCKFRISVALRAVSTSRADRRVLKAPASLLKPSLSPISACLSASNPLTSSSTCLRFCDSAITERLLDSRSPSIFFNCAVSFSTCVSVVSLSLSVCSCWASNCSNLDVVDWSCPCRCVSESLSALFSTSEPLKVSKRRVFVDSSSFVSASKDLTLSWSEEHSLCACSSVLLDSSICCSRTCILLCASSSFPVISSKDLLNPSTPSLSTSTAPTSTPSPTSKSLLSLVLSSSFPSTCTCSPVSFNPSSSPFTTKASMVMWWSSANCARSFFNSSCASFKETEDCDACC
eukprot:comp20083_c0_seq1/m.24730 comp20083_c0_seq1/g.24730  ORF comp20083_c0_seq1/g.24730 comp20083_c0_seq1/m.24730 type:complete len:313 (+) comp20083_c0_seq1:410-1348(+)